MLEMFRNFVMDGIMPGLEQFVIVFGTSFVVLLLGLMIFHKRQDRFIFDI